MDAPCVSSETARILDAPTLIDKGAAQEIRQPALQNVENPRHSTQRKSALTARAAIAYNLNLLWRRVYAHLQKDYFSYDQRRRRSPLLTGN